MILGRNYLNTPLFSLKDKMVSFDYVDNLWISHIEKYAEDPKVNALWKKTIYNDPLYKSLYGELKAGVNGKNWDSEPVLQYAYKKFKLIHPSSNVFTRSDIDAIWNSIKNKNTHHIPSLPPYKLLYKEIYKSPKYIQHYGNTKVGSCAKNWKNDEGLMYAYRLYSNLSKKSTNPNGIWPIKQNLHQVDKEDKRRSYICIALTVKGVRCSKRKTFNSELCGQHMKSYMFHGGAMNFIQ